MTEAEKAKQEKLKKQREKLNSLKSKGKLVDFFKNLFDKFAMAELKDGTQIMYEGDLAKGTVCTIEVDGAEVPLGEGTYELGGEMAGKSIVVDATGTVQELIDSAAASDDKKDDKKDDAQTEEGMKELAKLTTEKFAKIEEDFKAKFEAQKKENERLQSLIEKLAADFVAGKLTADSLKKTIDATKPDRTSKLA